MNKEMEALIKRINTAIEFLSFDVGIQVKCQSLSKFDGLPNKIVFYSSVNEVNKNHVKNRLFLEREHNTKDWKIVRTLVSKDERFHDETFKSKCIRYAEIVIDYYKDPATMAMRISQLRK